MNVPYNIITISVWNFDAYILCFRIHTEVQKYVYCSDGRSYFHFSRDTSSGDISSTKNYPENGRPATRQFIFLFYPKNPPQPSPIKLWFVQSLHDDIYHTTRASRFFKITYFIKNQSQNETILDQEWTLSNVIKRPDSLMASLLLSTFPRYFAENVVCVCRNSVVV